MGRPVKLGEDEVRSKLASVPGWELAGGKLHREFRFADFNHAFAFMTGVALVAATRDHHPDWSNVYDKVVIDLSTHDAGGITELDFALALAANELYDGAQ